MKIPRCEKCGAPGHGPGAMIFQCECGYWRVSDPYKAGMCSDCKEVEGEDKGKKKKVALVLCLPHELLRLRRFEFATRHCFGKLASVMSDRYKDA